MNAGTWSAIAAFIALAFTLMGAIAAGSYTAGKHSTRIENLEERQKETETEAKEARKEAAHASAQMAGFSATLTAFKDSVNSRLDEIMRALRRKGGASE